MAVKIYTGDTYSDEIEVTSLIDEDEEPFDLTDYDDIVVALKTSRDEDDEEAFIFEAGYTVGSPRDGVIKIHFSPEQTRYLPLTSEEYPTFYIFVQIGSTVTGDIREVYASKAKIIKGGVGRIVYADRGLDMGNIEETTGWIFEMGDLCEPSLQVVDLQTLEELPFFDGGDIVTDDIGYEIDCLALEDEPTVEILDMGTLEELC